MQSSLQTLTSTSSADAKNNHRYWLKIGDQASRNANYDEYHKNNPPCESTVSPSRKQSDSQQHMAQSGSGIFELFAARIQSNTDLNQVQDVPVNVLKPVYSRSSTPFQCRDIRRHKVLAGTVPPGTSRWSSSFTTGICGVATKAGTWRIWVSVSGVINS
jgi:hypothetical protein